MWRGGQTITVIRGGAPTINDFGEDVPGPPSEIRIDNCVVYPRTTEEQTQGRDLVITGLNVLMPPDAPEVYPTDQVDYRGVVYDVDGDVAAWRSPYSGWRPGVQFALTRVSGASRAGTET